MARSYWHLLRLLMAEPRPGEAVDDAHLLARFVGSNDAAAFELLVHRHAGMVFGTCRRICSDQHDAEDAFQATFLVLVRKAHSVRGNLAGWLHRTASRAALRAAKRAGRREASLPFEPVGTAVPDATELPEVLDSEIDRLPERLRLAVVLCLVEGRTTEDTASLLGVPRSTIQSRVEKARQLLTDRLVRRGFGVGAALTTVFANQSVSAALVARLTQSILTPAAGSAAQLLSLEVLRMTTWKTPAAVAAVLMMTAGIGTGVAVSLAGNDPFTQAPGAAPAAAPAAKPMSENDELKKLRIENYETLKEEIELRLAFLKAGTFDTGELSFLMSGQSRLITAFLALDRSPVDRMVFLTDQLEIAKNLESIMNKRVINGSLRKAEYLRAKSNRIEIEIQLMKSRDAAK